MTEEKYVITTEEIGNRIKNGAIAAGGAFAISALTNYRISQELMHEPSFGNVVRVSGWFALLSGLVWMFMPQAKVDPNEHMEELKRAITEPINVLIVRMTQNQRALTEDTAAADRRYISNSSTSWQSVGSSNRSSSYLKGWDKVKPVSIFDNDDSVLPPSDDDDDITDEELHDFYKDMETKYVL